MLKLNYVKSSVFGLLLVGSTGVSAEIDLRMASFASSGDSFGLAQTHFVELLDEKSDSQIKVDIHNNNTLGSNREALEMARVGGIDFVVTGLSHATRLAPVLNTVLLPYLWEDKETMFEMLDGEVGEKLNEGLEQAGLSIIGWWDNGFRHVSNNLRPILEPSDIQGLSLRTLPSQVHVEFFRKLGAVPTPMDFSELISALRQGVVDGQENPPAVVHPYGLYESQAYYSLTGHVNEPMILVARTSTLDSLPSEFREILDEAARETELFQRELNASRVDELMGLLATEMEVNEVPAETLDYFRNVAYEVYESNYESLGEDGKVLVEIILGQQ